MESLRVKPGEKFSIKKIDPSGTNGYDGDKEKAEKELLDLTKHLEILQEKLYAAGQKRLLVVLQGMDTSGKDGTIRHVFEGVNPQGVRVASFKAPTGPELGHDYLWRIHTQVPAKGEVVIFNRSHYEDVLVVRVHNLVPEEQWKRRYDQINQFEKSLVEEGTCIVKFFLHISKDEQKERLLERKNDPQKMWKFSPTDVKERQFWDDYMAAYEVALEKTSTDWAPWYVVPANRKWFRNLVIGRVLVKTLEDMDLKLPPPPPDLDKIVIE